MRHKACRGTVLRARRLRHGGAVDGKVKGHADVFVGKEIRFVVVKHAHRRKDLSRRPAALLRQLRDHLVRQVVNIVDLAVFVKLPRLAAAVGKDEVQRVGPDDARLVIFRVARGGQLTALAPLLRAVSAVAHERGFVERRALGKVAAQRHRGDRRADALDEIGAGRAQRDDKGRIILGRDLKLRFVSALAHLVVARHHAHERVVGGSRRRVGKALPGVDKIVRRDLLPIRPAGGGTQREGIGHGAVEIRLFAVFLGHAAIKHSLAAAAVAHAHEVFIEGVKNAVGVRVGVHRGVERCDLAANAGAEDEGLVRILLFSAAREHRRQHQRAEQHA